MDERIIYLVEQYLNHQIDAEGKQELHELISNNDHLDERMRQLFDEAPAEWDEADKMRILASIKMQINHDTPVKSNRMFPISIRWVAGIAAMLVLVLGFAWYRSSKPEQSQLLTVMTGTDEKSTVILPDRSKINLNADSKIVYSPDYLQSRMVDFSGEGFFQITHNPDCPFVVRCAEVMIRVLGTKFNLRAYSDSRRVTAVLNEGKIEMTTPVGVYELQPNEKITYDRDARSVEVDKVHAADFSDWRNRHLVVDSVSLGTLAMRISAMYDVHVEFESPVLSRIRLTGTIDNRSLNTVLEMIRLSTGIAYKIEPNRVLLYRAGK